jgi:replicative DNA helicase
MTAIKKILETVAEDAEAQARAKKETAANDTWETPVPIEDHRQVPPFPSETLPTHVARFCDALTKEMHVPIDLPAVMALGALATVVAPNFRVMIGPNHFEGGNLFLVALALPSMLKSPVKSACFDAIDKEELERLKRWRTKESARQEVIKVAKAVEKKRVRTMASGAEAIPTEEEVPHVPPAEPKPTMFADDVTSEKLAVLMSENGGTLTVASAEAKAFEHVAGLYKSNPDPNVYLQAYSGDTIRVHRLGRPDVFVAHPALTLCLAVQPESLKMLSKRPELRGRGLHARFLLSRPRTSVGYRDWTASIPTPPAIRLEYNHLLRELLAIAPAEQGAKQVVRFSIEAQDRFKAWRNELEAMFRPEGRLEHWQDFGGKLAGTSARIALLLHVADHKAESATVELEVSTLERAIVMSHYFADHTLSAWMTGESVNAQRLLGWLKKRGGQPVTRKEIQRLGPSSVRPKEATAEALAVLLDAGWIRKRSGSESFDCHPLLRIDSATPATSATEAPD